ncbi:hypothetical protein HAZT_HAZT007452 [Hyalella azteca]|uniref:Uncharacterized protein n=1 Tax=Hyalella azteca TaxID=294128 RepID=A0A6A0H7T9_HYAAZ|nr:hypothetical protein HAZT_HAZT007452 [Hyalella azteca]
MHQQQLSALQQQQQQQNAMHQQQQSPMLDQQQSAIHQQQRSPMHQQQQSAMHHQQRSPIHQQQQQSAMQQQQQQSAMQQQQQQRAMHQLQRSPMHQQHQQSAMHHHHQSPMYQQQQQQRMSMIQLQQALLNEQNGSSNVYGMMPQGYPLHATYTAGNYCYPSITSSGLAKRDSQFSFDFINSQSYNNNSSTHRPAPGKAPNPYVVNKRQARLNQKSPYYNSYMDQTSPAGYYGSDDFTQDSPRYPSPKSSAGVYADGYYGLGGYTDEYIWVILSRPYCQYGLGGYTDEMYMSHTV